MILYSPQHRVLFFHVHKTGGISVTAALRALLPDLAPIAGLETNHTPLVRCLRLLNEAGVATDSIRILATICHPVAHSVSLHSYYRSSRVAAEDRSKPKVVAARSLDLATFIRESIKTDQFADALLVRGDLPDNVTLMRRETLEADLRRFLSDVVGIDAAPELLRLNSSGHAPLSSLATPEVIDAVREVYSWTFERGYYTPDVIPADGAVAIPSLGGRIRLLMDRPLLQRLLHRMRHPLRRPRSR